ncbi:TlyA family RNA methyltransferase [Natranaerofaba carboxydovora]|uniref:TlyA family RNA methyltransferase n=1 Tax=Natranaerofaba carboxydovora TaxID=2742683 RepID=UPI001F12A1DA|nr:TlyA family RNA methyltransferase [Natranaerofaba carboxydovora]UMZ73944.1 16S/23S rRNA (cytidine-2'-O)-methyltransferase TlyA [Natranaerofaba carboxydovora]
MGYANKKRLDQILVDKNYSLTREKAKRLIMSGVVFIDGERIDKPGTKIRDDLPIEIKEKASERYVSRGGLKLEKALQSFEIDVNNRVCLDIGASTGGFTHCLLINGARHVYAVDVGYGQLAWQLRQDQRVSVFERTNIRYVEKDLFTAAPDLACVDVSFISLDLVIPKLKDFIVYPKTSIVLIKPQFELSRDKIGKKGVVKDPNFHKEAIKKVIYKAQEHEFVLRGLTYSPIKGPKGNIEYLAYFEELSKTVTVKDMTLEVSKIVNDVVYSANIKL